MRHFLQRSGIVLLLSLITVGVARGQGIDPVGRPVADIRLEGLKHVDPQLLYNQIRVRKGDPYEKDIVDADLRRLTHLNRFRKVEALIDQQADGSIILVYRVAEMALITDVQVVGNKVMPDQKLIPAVRLRAGDPVEDYLIDVSKRKIVELYKQDGYFDTTVTVDRKLLGETGILLFRVVEGPHPRIRAIRFEGNKAFTDRQLRSKVSSKTYVLLLRRGLFSRQRTLDDAGRLRQFYRDRGYLDAEVIRDVATSPDGRETIVTFTIHEGDQYTVSSIFVKGNKVFSEAQIREVMLLRVGDVFSLNLMEKSTQALVDHYGDLGFIDARVVPRHIFLDDQPHRVDVLVSIAEGRPYWVGKVSVKGNNVTQDRVVKRMLRGLYPGRHYSSRAIRRAEARIGGSALFEQGKITVLGDRTDEERDLLVEVKEKNTGSVGFGAGISSDAGIVGAFDVTQRNFDITDTPDTLGELFSGKAFRGAGQFLRLAVQPGNESSRYSISFREPYLRDSSYFFDTSIFFFDRERSDYDERRVGASMGVGQRFGEIWSATVRGRAESIDIEDIDSDAPVDVFAVEGSSELTSLGFSIRRIDVDSRTFPTRGSRFEAGVTRTGTFGGDYDFTSAAAEYRQYFTVDEDFFERRTVLSMRVRGGYIFEDDEAPVFERFYAGGHRTLRGFDYRGIGPRGIRADTGTLGDDPVGGDFLFLFNIEYNLPVYEEAVRWVFFVDTGTIDEDISFSEYRVAVGTGLRLLVPFLGDAPFALDIAIPVVKEEDDDERFFSFDLAIPF